MLKEKLIQNYYEINGNFDGITTSNIGHLLDDASSSVIDNCYKILGYQGTDNFTPKEVHDVRIAYLKEDLDFFKDKFNLNSVSEIEYFFKGNKLEIPPKHDFQLTDKYIKMLAKYLAMPNDIIILYNGGNYRLDEVIYLLKLGTTNVNQDIRDIVDHNPDIIRFEKSTDEFISDGVMHTKKVFSEQAKKKLLVNALRMAADPGLWGVPQTVMSRPMMIPVLQFVAPGVYINLMEHAEIQGITYQKLLANAGFNIYDYSYIYSILKCIPIVVLNNVYILDDNSSKDQIYKCETIDDFEIWMSMNAMKVEVS